MAERTRAWKFLDERSRGVFSGFDWPTPAAADEPGDWVQANGPIAPCLRGIHACRSQDLGWWLSAQLWEIELDGDSTADDYSIVAPRGRLVRRIAAWPDAGADLADWARWRCRDATVQVVATTDPQAAGSLASCVDFDGMRAVLAPLDADRSRPDGLAIALLKAAAASTNPVGVCAIAGLAAGHAASVTNGSVAAHRAALADERRAHGRWLADRLDLRP